jgi:hypothetical protein
VCQPKKCWKANKFAINPPTATAKGVKFTRLAREFHAQAEKLFTDSAKNRRQPPVGTVKMSKATDLRLRAGLKIQNSGTRSWATP